MHIILSDSLKQQALTSARQVADWLVNTQTPASDADANAGNFHFGYDAQGNSHPAFEWNLAFASMGLCSASTAFNNPTYANAAERMMGYLKTLQIFSPFLPQHYGALRETSPQTPWCYTRDAVSGAWGFLEYFRFTHNPEFLERATLWAQWFLKNGLDETQWPHWGIQFEPYVTDAPQMCNDMHGCFQGGGLNFFYHLAKETGDDTWTTGFYTHMADYFVSHVQQPDGFFRTIEKATGKVPENDPQNGLHRANDDLGTLALLGAYRLTGNKRYLEAIEKFLSAVFQRQRSDGHFEDSCAAIPVVLNILHEVGDDLDFKPADGAVEAALQALFKRQFSQDEPLCFRGAYDETGSHDACARSACYALIVLLKLATGDNRYLTC